MTEMQFQAIMNRNKCPAEFVNEVEGKPTPIDCQRCNYNCRKCVEDFIEEVNNDEDE